MPWARIVEESKQKYFCKIPEKRKSRIRRPIVHLVIYKIILYLNFLVLFLTHFQSTGFLYMLQIIALYQMLSIKILPFKSLTTAYVCRFIQSEWSNHLQRLFNFNNLIRGFSFGKLDFYYLSYRSVQQSFSDRRQIRNNILFDIDIPWT